MFKSKKGLYSVVLTTFFVTLSGCAGTTVSQYSYNESQDVNVPTKGAKCYDASVLLGADIKRSKDIASKVIIALDSEITQDTPTSIKAQRNRHIGLIVGSGGEELGVNLQEIASDKTFVSATTKTGFVGAAGQKPWSCKIVDEMVKMVSK